jgi:excisionase family DNA binding protein
MSEARYVDVHELCRRYSLRLWSVRTWCSQQRIPFVRVGGRKVLFDVEEIERWLKEQAVQPQEPRVPVEP